MKGVRKKIKQRERERDREELCVCVCVGGDNKVKLVKQIEGSPEVELRVT